jgi:pimeloyl-ACP methyl ester carboxylesterase
MIGGFPDERSKAAYHQVYDALLEWPLPSEDLIVTTTFGPTYVRKSGSGDGIPLVLLHGVLATSLSWQAYVGELGRNHTVYAVDSIGEPGRSTLTRPMTDAQANAGWLGEVLDGLGHDRVHLAGISRGGWLALNLGLRDPRRVKSITAFDPRGLDEIGLRQYRWVRDHARARVRPEAGRTGLQRLHRSSRLGRRAETAG